MTKNSRQRALKKQQGSIMLAVTLLILFLVTLGTLYTGKIKALEHKVTLNTQNYKTAFAAAEAGLMQGFARVQDEPRWNGTVFAQVQSDQTQFSVSGTRQLVVRDTSNATIITFTSTGFSADGLSTVIMTEQGLQYSVLANPPDVPLMVAGGLDVSGNFEVIANPNGGGTGVPLSIWTDGVVDLTTGSGTTCGLQEFNDGNCSSSPYSSTGNKGIDILDGDLNFPSDMFEYLFNVPEAEWADFRADADIITNTCSGLNAATTGVVWVDGDCTLNAGTIVASISSPVILIVSDGDLRMNGGAEIFGMVFSFRKPGNTLPFDLNMIGSARVNGVVASNHPVGTSGGTYNSVFNQDVLNQLEQNDVFRRIARVPGSWRDF